MSRSMKDRVASLLRKANDPAASEAEAETCMNMAMGLMAKFGLSMDDVTGDDAEQIGFNQTEWQPGRGGDAMQYVSNAIAAFTSTRAAFQGNSSAGTRMTYYGYEAERQLALWLHNHIRSAIETESRLYIPPVRNTRLRAKDRRSFAVYMAKRISDRLYRMAETLDDAGRGTGTDVMVVKNAKLDQYFTDLDLRAARRTKRSFFQEGAKAGMAAGDKLSLHRPISEASGPLRLSKA